MRYLTLALTFITVLPACSKPKSPAVQAKLPAVRWLLPDEFARIAGDKDALVVNVQSSPSGEIPGTRLLVSGERAFESLKVVQPDRTKPIALYCEQQQLSDTLAEQLVRAGYASVCVLRGGYRSWIERGLPFRIYNNRE
jgi:rhodanese-related sulfurtransferase